MPENITINDAAKLSNILVPRVIGDMKAIAKRLTPEGGQWPDEIRNALRFFREMQDELDQRFPANIK